MKVLLVAVNAKYIHSNLGIYSLKACAGQRLEEWGCRERMELSLAEYTINHRQEQILQDIYRRKPEIIGFSCYIWNISCIRELLSDLKKVLPGTRIWLGGPEVSYDAERVLEENPAAELVMTGEGEETFARLLRAAWEETGSGWEKRLETIPGIAFRGSEAVVCTPPCPPVDLSRLPFPYEPLDPESLEHRIIYYESSRGCPFSCAYCLSSIDRQVRFRSLELVRRELGWFLERRVPQVKFVDRTFNCKKDHAMEIWRFIRDHDNGITNFHFEIAADLLGEEELALLETMRPGLVQLEIGVQSTNPETLEAIRRRTDIRRIGEVTARINSWRRIHQHLDLIAGLPWENMESFRRSFNQVFAMEPEQLQLGFLKVLKGSPMEQMAEACGLVASSRPPYEVLSTRWLSYGDILELKQVEEMTEIYYNSRQFTETLKELVKEYASPYEMFREIAAFRAKRGDGSAGQSRLARYEMLWELVGALASGERREQYRDCLVCDLYLRENCKSRPSFARDPGEEREARREFFRREAESPRYLTGYQGYDARQLARMAHLERLRDGSFLLFDYSRRDPLSTNARTVRLRICEDQVMREAEPGRPASR